MNGGNIECKETGDVWYWHECEAEPECVVFKRWMRMADGDLSPGPDISEVHIRRAVLFALVDEVKQRQQQPPEARP